MKAFSISLILVFISELSAIAIARAPALLSSVLSQSRTTEIRKRIFVTRRTAAKRSDNNDNDIPGSSDDVEVIAAAAVGKKNAKVAPEVSLNAFDLCLCGAFATALGDFVMHPVDTIKVTQQAATAASGLLATTKAIWAKGGIMAFYPGVVPYMTADGISGAIKFASFEVSRAFLSARLPAKFHPSLQFVCAAGAMIACSVVMVPGEVIKIRLQAGMVKNMVEGITQTIKQDGIMGLYAGYYATLVRDVPYTMLELGLYENIKSAVRFFQAKKDLTQGEELMAAAVTGGITSFITTPLDLIKTKLMMQSTSMGGQYSGVVDAVASIYKEGGINALFTGSAARVGWLLPFTTIYLGVYELSKRRLLAFKQTLAARAVVDASLASGASSGTGKQKKAKVDTKGKRK